MFTVASLWIPFTIIAALGQVARNAMQRSLTGPLGTVGATMVRFLYGLPFGLLFLAAVFQLSDSAQVVTSCAIRGYKVTRSPMVIHLTAFWVFSLPLGCVLGLAPQWLPWRPAQAMGAQGFWIALVVGLTVAALGLVILLRKVALDHLPGVPAHGRTA